MLVVLALLALLMGVLTATVSLGISARSRVTAVALDQQDFASFRRILNDKLGQAYPQWITINQTGAIDFSGTPQQLDFLGPALDMQGPGLAHYDISLTQQNGKPAILLQSSYAEATQVPSLATNFATGLATLKIEYFGPPQDGAPAEWQDHWMMRTRLPELVAIDITFPKGDRRSWPVLVIHPQVDADVTCEIDPNTHFCLGR